MNRKMDMNNNWEVSPAQPASGNDTEGGDGACCRKNLEIAQEPVPVRLRGVFVRADEDLAKGCVGVTVKAGIVNQSPSACRVLLGTVIRDRDGAVIADRPDEEEEKDEKALERKEDCPLDAGLWTAVLEPGGETDCILHFTLENALLRDPGEPCSYRLFVELFTEKLTNVPQGGAEWASYRLTRLRLASRMLVDEREIPLVFGKGHERL